MQTDLNSLLAPGDIVFIATPNFIYRRIARDTESKASHVGIVFYDQQQGWLVAESRVPLACYTPLAHFLARSDAGWYAIRRYQNGLTPEQVECLRQACDARMGIAYEPGFSYESKRLFCSKLVYEVYQEALGISIGELETLDQICKKSGQISLLFWRLWFLGRIPWQRLTITPASQLNSPLLQTICESAGS